MIPRTSALGKPMCIDATEVTNAEYALFVEDQPSLELEPASCAFNTSFAPAFGWPDPADPDRPVGNVNWCDAFAFCKWAGKHLCGRAGGEAGALDGDLEDPVESEWFDACSAKGAREYPYAPGDAFDASACNGLDLHRNHAVDVGSLPECVGSEPGLFDMSGNLWEWEDACEGDAPSAQCRVRGGSFRADALNLRCSSYEAATRDTTYDFFGFRCCAD
jgi:formylglycine-generating enzyme required for sulfatase activity